jgi:monoamine oxidase
MSSKFSNGEVDIAVIGAGAAGIAAGRRLLEAGLTFILLEARSRVGGRAWTVEREGLPLDLGCGWLHSGDLNPWTKIAEATGFAVDRTPAPWTSHNRDLSLGAGEYQEYRTALAAFYRRLGADGAAPDHPASDFLESGGRWNELINAVSTYANGAELDEISVQDVSRYDDDEVNWRVRQGYGTLIASYAKPLPVVTDCVVTEIDHSGAQLTINASRGQMSAKRVIVTLPTNVLASGSVRFTPDLPDKLDAAAGLPLGLADKVWLALERPDDFPVETRLFGRTDRTGTGAYHVRPLGRPVIEAYFGGRLARRLEKEGEGASAAFAIEEISAQLGAGLKTRLQPLASTAWASDPFARGSYSHALPGRAGARAVLSQPIDDRLFFAGEACSAGSFSTAHGAYETGVAAAEAAMRGLLART